MVIHFIYAFLIVLIVIFCKNVNYLFLTIIIITLNIYSIFILTKCPLQLLETKYLGIPSYKLILYPFLCHNKKNNKKCKKNKKCKENLTKHIHSKFDEIAVEILIYAWVLIATKILYSIIYY
jgi:hypothetical protein